MASAGTQTIHIDKNPSCAQCFTQKKCPKRAVIQFLPTYALLMLTLAQANSTLGMRGQFGAIKKVALSVNGDDPIEVDLGVDEMKMTLVDLGKTQRISDIKITVLESTPGSTKSVGFSGIELLRQ